MAATREGWKKRLREWGSSTFGHLLVVFSSMQAGAMIGGGPTLRWEEKCLYLLAVSGLLGCRLALYEEARQDDNPAEEAPNLLRFAAVLALVPTVIAIPIGFLVRWQLGIAILVALVPLAVVTVWLFSQWPEGKPEAWHFLARCLFPAFAALVPAWLFGIEGSPVSVVSLLGGAGVLAAWGAARRAGRRSVYYVGLALVLFSMVVYLAPPATGARDWPKIAQSVVFGYLLTLVMGVAEGWRMCSRANADQDSRPTPYTPEEKARYRAGANFASALFPPTFVLTTLLPATGGVYFMTVALLVTFSSFTWLLFASKLTWNQWNWIGIATGFAFPLAVATAGFGPSALPGMLPKIPADQAINYVALLFALCVPFYRQTRRQLTWSLSMFADRRLSVLILATACWSFAGIVGLTAGAYKSIAGVEALARLEALTGFYVFLCALCLLVLFLRFIEAIPATLLPALLVMARPVTSSVAGMVALCAAAFGGRSTVDASLYGVGLTLCTAAGFVGNDISDREVDRAMDPRVKRKPLALGEVSLRTAQRWLLTLCVGVVVVSCFLPDHEWWALVGALAVTLVYSPFANAAPLLKGAYTAVLCLLPFAVPLGLAGCLERAGQLTLAVLFCAGREALLDARDWSVDSRSGRRTLAVRFGTRLCRWLGWSTMLAVAVALCVVAFLGGGGGHRVLAVALVAVVGVAALEARRNETRGVAYSRWAMLAGGMLVSLPR